MSHHDSEYWPIFFTTSAAHDKYKKINVLQKFQAKEINSTGNAFWLKNTYHFYKTGQLKSSLANNSFEVHTMKENESKLMTKILVPVYEVDCELFQLPIPEKCVAK